MGEYPFRSIPLGKSASDTTHCKGKTESHKGTYGRVLAVCGCAQYRGAAAPQKHIEMTGACAIISATDRDLQRYNYTFVLR